MIQTYSYAKNSSPDGLKTQYKSDHTEPDRREIGKEPSMHGHRRILPKYNTRSRDTENNNK